MKTLKYNEFLALDDFLENKGSSVNEFVKEITGKPLYEAEEEIDEKKPGLMWLTSPKGAWAKKSLTKAAKRLLESIKTDILQKFYDQALENQKEILQQAMALLKAGKTPEEIFNSLQGNIEVMRTAQQKQLKILNDGIEKLIANASRRVTSYISKKQLRDSIRLTLENYWVLLTVQVHQITLNSIIEKEKEFVHSIVGEKENLVKFAQKIIGIEEVEKLVKEKEQEKKEVKQRIRNPKKVEEKTAETPKVGEIWSYVSTAKGKDRKTKIVKILKLGGETSEVPEGKIQVQGMEKEGGVFKKKEYSSSTGKWAVPEKIFSEPSSKKLKDASDEKEEEINPENYKKGSKWIYDGKKGELEVEVVGPENGGVRVKGAGRGGNGWIVKDKNKFLKKA